MKKLFLTLCLCMCACQSAEETTSADGRKGYHVTADGNRTECLALAGQSCKSGFDIIEEPNPSNSMDCSMIVACHPEPSHTNSHSF